ncbi:MAG: hypothetical protein LBR28_00440 [Bacteroidales bacterium]|jgi:hypothetical protein|nr:hypothetical protein [Bacteroidales bacterium]
MSFIIQNLRNADFMAFVENFQKKAQNYATLLGIPASLVADLQTDYQQLKDCQNEIISGNHTKMQYEMRNMVRKRLEHSIINVRDNHLKHNPNADNSIWVDFGLHVPSKTKSAIHVPEEAPHFEISFRRSEHELHFGKLVGTSEIKRGLPHGATGIEIKRKIGGEAPVSPNDMDFYGVESKSPVRIVYDTTFTAQKVWYVMRYYNFKGEYSLWSDIKLGVVN